MLKCLIWGNGRIFHQYINTIKYYENLGEIGIVGISSNMVIFDNILGYKCYNPERVTLLTFDVVIVMADDHLFIEIKKEIERFGIDKKIVPYKVLTIPKVDLKRYMEIINNNVSIFANNCWGGLVYHRLGLQFRSPLINMFFHDEDYLKFLSNPRKYINTKLSLKKEYFLEETQKSFPICQCDDILLYFNHSESFEEANSTWEKRKKRINWDNIFVMMYTENKDVALDFSKLPYSKKVCFVPFQTDIECLFSLDFYEKDELSKLEFWQIVNGSISGMFECYDLVELLCSGKILRTAE